MPVNDLNLDSLDCGLKKLSSLSGGYAISLVRLDELCLQLLEAGIYLTPLEQTRFLEFRYEKRKIEWLGGRIAAKHAVMRLLTPDYPENLLNWHEWCVVPDKHNRPFIESSGTTRKNPAPYISISHSNGLAVAMASATPCGIDIQKVSSTVTKVEEKFMRPEENVILTQCEYIAEMDAAERLTLLWSAKEAFRKTFFLIPLLGFLELSLIKASGTLKRGLVLDFIYSGQDARCKEKKVFSAAAGFHEDFAVAATSVSSRDCI
ncbi:MAG: 4'-phosphopantetheinyl transferase superfamily protein [Thermodesulfobacteriota bacterium]|nr:4'-phosphopantetheinyl transferase superfamily protein [Thermodesulfobacteriota bacterium]